MKKGEKKEENYIKKGEKALKMHLLRLRPARRKLIGRGKKLNLIRGGEIIRMHNIYPCNRYKPMIVPFISPWWTRGE